MIAQRCHSCGAALAPGATVCPACGEPQVAAERKVVTVLFADLAGYTSLAESLDPEEVLAVVRPWMTELRLIVERHGGTVPQVMGDGFMAVFGVPNAHEDDAERAVRAGLALTAHAQTLAARQTGINFPGVRVGINTGEVMVAGSREASGFAVVGDAVNVSARLAGLAESGRVLVGVATHRLTGARIRYGGRIDRTAKGKSAPVATYEALRAQPQGGPVRVPRRTAFVGRERVLSQLLADAAIARDERRSRVRVVVAEPGVGKTRLAAELRSRLGDFAVFAGASHPYGQRLPLAAIADAVGAHMGIAPDADQESARRAIRRHLRRMALSPAESGAAEAQIERVLGIAESGATDAAESTDRPGGTSVDTAQAARESLRYLATGRPALVILDDLHWADTDQLTFVANLHRAPWDEPFFVLALAREEPDEWRRGLPTTNLAGLSAADARTVIAGAIGAGVPADVAKRLVERAAGNPLFLEESARMLVERGALERGGRAWRLADPRALEQVPASLRQLVASRIDRLPAAAKRAAQDASVGGAQTWDTLIARMASLRTSTDDTDGIAELEARDILRRRPASSIDGAVEFEFKHVVIRDVAYESLPRAERAARHEIAADWLIESQADPPVASIAHHYERAWQLASSTAVPPTGREGRVAAQATAYLRRWGDSVFALQPRLALELYERGLTIGDNPASGVPTDEIARLLVGRAEGLSAAGRHRDAMTAADRALALTVEPGAQVAHAFAQLALARAHSNLGSVTETRTLATAALDVFEQSGDTVGQARGHHLLAEAQRFDDLPSQVAAYRRAYALYRQARATRERASVAEDLAYLMTVVGGPEADRWLERARRFAERTGDERARAAIKRASAYAAFYRGDLDAAMRAAAEARVPAATIGDRWIEVDSLLIEALVQSAAGSPEDALAIVRRLVAIADSAGARHLRALVLGAGARAAQRAGHPQRAANWLRTMRTTLDELGAQMEMAEVELLDATLHLERGAWDRVAGPARAGERVARKSGWRLLRANGPLLRGRALLGAGKPDAAIAELTRAVRIARLTGAVGPQLIAEAALRQAVASSGETAGRAEGKVTPAGGRRSALAGREPAAMDLETEGFVALRRGDTRAAAEAFSRAVRVWQGLGFTVWQARAERLRSEALAASGRKWAARASARRADAILARLRSPLYRSAS